MGESLVGSDDEVAPKTSKQVIAKATRCFASVRAGLSDQKVKSAELTRLIQVCMAKLDQQSITLERLLLESAADADKFAALAMQLTTMSADLITTSDKKDVAVEEEDAVSWVVSVRESHSQCLSFTRLRHIFGRDSAV